MEHRVMEVCVGICASTSTQQTLTALAAQECHMLNKVGNTLQQQQQKKKENP